MVRCAKKKFQNFLLIAIDMTVLSVFLQKKGLGPLGVKLAIFHDLALSLLLRLSLERTSRLPINLLSFV